MLAVGTSIRISTTTNASESHNIYEEHCIVDENEAGMLADSFYEVIPVEKVVEKKWELLAWIFRP